MTSVLSSLRYLFADVLGDDDAPVPFLPENLPEAAAAIVAEGVHLLIDYQGPSYAQLYVDRVKRFIGRPHVDAALLCEIARLLALRMAYEDLIRIAQLKLTAMETGHAARAHAAAEVRRFRLDELVGVLPKFAADSLMSTFEKIGWLHRRRVSVRFSTASKRAVGRLKLFAGLKRWRLQSVRYAEERIWVERWLHMIARCLDKQPASAAAVVETATMIQGQGDAYWQGLADWHVIVGGLVKPTFDGGLPLADLAGAIAEARAAAMPDPRQASLKRTIAQIRARTLADHPGAKAAE